MERAGLGLCDACGKPLGIAGVNSDDGNNYIFCSINCFKEYEFIKKIQNLQSEASALDTQEGGGHYRILKIQPIEYILANGLGYIEGNVVKYITRHRLKNGAEDIRKIIHYCELLLELEYKEERGGLI